MEKTCFKCGCSKPLGEFYRHPMMADGRLGKCKDCTKRDVAANYRARREQYAEYERRRNQEPERRRMASEYLKRRPAHKVLANRMVSNAIRDGRLVRQPCEVCGESRSEAHHDDYSKPLDVRWLCREHHLAVHGKQLIKPQPQGEARF